jgi:hypothetical protein
MKKQILIPAFLGGLMTFSLTTQAQDRPGQGGRDGADPRQGIREAMMKKFDKNGDGKLDEKERPSREQLQEFFRAQLGGGQGRPSGGQGRPSGDQGRPSGGQGGPGQGRPDAGGPGQGGPGQGGGFGGRGGFRPPNPVMEAIDKNKDGTLSADELKNATKALAALDKNKDGKIDREEMRPQFDRGQGGRGEGRPGQGGQGGRGEGRPGQGGQGGRGEGRPGAGGRENPRGPREGNRNQPRPKRSDS